MSLWLRLAWRELRNSPRFTLFFVLNLALGLLGFLLLDSFKLAFDHELDQRSRNLLSADLALSARRPLTDDELRAARELIRRLGGGDAVREARFVSMFTMARGPGRSRLVELNAIDAAYPFYGELTLQDGERVTSSTSKAPLQAPVAWIYPELAVQLGLKAGDELGLGNSRFRVGGTISSDTGNAWRGFSLATRVYIGLPFLERTGLIRKGSTVSYTWFYALGPGVTGAQAEALARELNHALTDPAIQVRTHRDASEEIGRLIHYLNDFLGLVALVALFLSGIGAAYLFRSYLADKVREIAILESLGSSPSRTRTLYLLQLTLLGCLSAAVTLLAAGLLLPALRATLRRLLPFELRLVLSPRSAALTLVLGAAGSLLICLPLLQRLKGLKPASLFQESATPSLSFSPRQALGILPALACFWALAVWQSHSLKMGSLFLGLFLSSAALLAGLGMLCLRMLRGLEDGRGYVARSAFRSLRRSRLSSLSCFVALGMGSLLLNLVPEIQQNIQSEFTEPEGAAVPSLFLFDIQDEQLVPLKQYLASQTLELRNISPLIRSRLNAINGKPFLKEEAASAINRPKSREEEQDQRFRNRGFNLSYRDGLQDSESLVRGRLWSGPFSGAPDAVAQVSVEHRSADRLGIHLGDLLDFDVQGIPVRARVTSLRKIRWTSFQPNFFVLFQPGVLEDAPKTFIGNIPPLGVERKVAIQNGIVERFPNVSMVDVTELVGKILRIFRQMGVGIQGMAILTLVAGLAVLFSIANHQAAGRAQESNLLKVLGARFRDIRRIQAIEFGLLGLVGAASGTLISYVVSYILSVVVFEGVWVFSWKVPLLSVGVIAALAVGTATLATRRVLRRKPIELLQG